MSSPRPERYLPDAPPNDTELLNRTVLAVEAAAQSLRTAYDPWNRPVDKEAILAALRANDECSLDILRPALGHVHPCRLWSEDDVDEEELASGEWWVTDAAEGNINHIHGLAEWGVSATLVREGIPILTAISLPLVGHTYRALRGEGAFLGNVRLSASAKVDLGISLVGTAQARHDDGPDINTLLSGSVSTMLDRALLVRVTVPSTLQLLDVATGRAEAFWQYTTSTAGLLCGSLLVAEAGGVVSETSGGAWKMGSASFLAAAPGLHRETVAALAGGVQGGDQTS